MELVDLAFRQGDDHHARELQVLVERRHVRLVAAHPVERLGDHDLEHSPPRVVQQSLDAGTEDHAGAGDGGVLVRAGDLPALARRALAEDPELVLDRRRPPSARCSIASAPTPSTDRVGHRCTRVPGCELLHPRRLRRLARRYPSRTGIRAIEAPSAQKTSELATAWERARCQDGRQFPRGLPAFQPGVSTAAGLCIGEVPDHVREPDRQSVSETAGTHTQQDIWFVNGKVHCCRRMHRP